jgi:hypothetical protein
VLGDDDDLSWYARRAPAAAALAAGPRPEARVAELLAELAAAGVRGDAGALTLFTRGLPDGCRTCLKGRGTNLFVTGLCTRDCFFCFNEKPRRDELVVHGIPVRSPEQAAAVVERYGLRSVGLSGGEPLLAPARVLAVLGALRALGRPPRIDLYTNGDLIEEALLRRLRDAGLDSLRLNMAARRYELSPLGPALAVFPGLAVEMPAVPAELGRQKRLLVQLERLGVRHAILHELFVCRENAERMAAEGHAASGEPGSTLLWQPVPESRVAALELLLFARRHTPRLGAYFCSCGTQERIGARGLARRRRLSP